jgi:hypothetical protein
MATELQIGRFVEGEGRIVGPIALEEWRAAVQRVDGVREAEAPPSLTLPSGETLVGKLSPGDAEIYFSGPKQWRLALWYSAGIASFRGQLVMDPDGRRVVRKLAIELGAQLRTEEGEIYSNPSRTKLWSLSVLTKAAIRLLSLGTRK